MPITELPTRNRTQSLGLPQVTDRKSSVFASLRSRGLSRPTPPTAHLVSLHESTPDAPIRQEFCRRLPKCSFGSQIWHMQVRRV